MARKIRLWLGTTAPYVRLKQIEALDFDRDYREITKLFYADFQSAIVAKSVNGFMMNYAAPRISRVLGSSGELEHRMSRRVIDTIILASVVMMEGFTGKGRDAARRINAMHSKYDIQPDDFIAVGAEEAVGSIVLADLYGWRAGTDKEREAVNRSLSLHSDRTAGRPRRPRLRHAPCVAPVEIAGPCRAQTSGGQAAGGRRAPSHLDALVRDVYPNGYEISQVGTHVTPPTSN